MLTLFLLLAISNLVNTCDQYWQYVRNGNQYEGLLEVKLDKRFTEHKITAILTVASKLKSSYFGEILLTKDAISALNDVQNEIPVHYRIKFPIQNPYPQLSEVIYNKQRICTSPKAIGSYVTTISLDFVLFLENIENQTPKPVPPGIFQKYRKHTFELLNTFLGIAKTEAPTSTFLPTQAPTMIYSPIPTRPPTLPPHSLDFKTISDSDQCGVPSNSLPQSIGLVVNGKPAQIGQFPWLAAFYHKQNGRDSYICGGSLISTSSIITAAHCVHDKYDYIKKEADSTFYLGKFDLKSEFDANSLKVYVAQFIIHQDWDYNSENFDGDIAIAKLSTTVVFSSSIKPICLWTESGNHYDIVNKFGIVAGYGKTNAYSKVSDVPYWTVLPVVDEGTCLRSNFQFAKITSRRTFCVGSRDGRGPCQGDSGGGFIMQSNGKWYLRGIVSSSLIDDKTFSCDTNNYAVFTDVQSFQPWIKTYI